MRCEYELVEIERMVCDISPNLMANATYLARMHI
jgi:hypothetical protein